MFWNKEDVKEEHYEYDERAVKSSFERVKNDIFYLGNELSNLKTEIIFLKQQFSQTNDLLNSMKIELLTLKHLQNYQKTQIPTYNPAQEVQKYSIPTDIPTQEPIKPAVSHIPSNTPTVPVEIEGLKSPILNTSIGNEGVPTDKQTHQQTGNSLQVYTVREVLNQLKSPSINLENTQKIPVKSVKDHIEEASNILDSLDGLKKEIRLKFKGITNQEMLVFSTVFQLEEAYPEGVEYKQIATKLGLSESSIRDYIQKLINKGIPVDKTKVNNKKICLKISQNLKKIASLATLVKLREL